MKNKEWLRPICDQCEVLVINNVPCHEHGCPNRDKPWEYERPEDE